MPEMQAHQYRMARVRTQSKMRGHGMAHVQGAAPYSRASASRHAHTPRGKQPETQASGTEPPIAQTQLYPHGRQASPQQHASIQQPAGQGPMPCLPPQVHQRVCTCGVCMRCERDANNCERAHQKCTKERSTQSTQMMHRNHQMINTSHNN